jgi:hypothetical protein
VRLSIKLAALATAVAAAATASGSVASAADGTDTPSSIVEDFAYPNRDQILAQYGVKLNSGDGHLLFVDCGVTGDKILVETYEHADYVCFQLTGPHGYLSLEIGQTVFIYSENRSVEATVQLQGRTEPEAPKTVAPNSWTTFGEAANQPPAILLELRAGFDSIDGRSAGSPAEHRGGAFRLSPRDD